MSGFNVLGIINFLIDKIGGALTWILQLLPDSPFTIFEDASFLPDWVTWSALFIPWPGMLSVATAYIAAVTVYYSLRIALRWFKAVGD